ncbi:MAG: DUF4202 domain-containing protein [Chloroflexota bacterium]|nr:DUF4202 domain-containing protein [Chloroflexota bacterium]MDE2919422.1 DUF4202 domain-containing protein [Chloroflexota bacterium]
MTSARLRRALARIDEINRADPHEIQVRGESRPKELTHAAMVSAWMERLCPDADDALRIAAHGHHVRRWTIPRREYPRGRRGYLRWRQALQELHAATLGEVMTEAGYHAAAIERAQDLVRKKNLRRDPDVQALEDALCLVFLETQLGEFRTRQPDDRVTEVLRKTWDKMSAEARALAVELDLASDDRRFLQRVLRLGDAA